MTDGKVSRKLAALYQVTIEADASSAERIARALDEAEPAPLAVGLFEFGQDRFEVFAHYGDAPPRDGLIELVQEAIGRSLPLRLEAVADADWVTLSQGKRPPVRAGRFLVHGSHDRDRVSRHVFAVEIDAAQAFGTAHHASTRGSLVALDGWLKRRHKRVLLDVGTGTGVLAIAAAKALRDLVLASDSDPLAVSIAAANARKNGVAPFVRVLKAEGFAHPRLKRIKADLVLANLLELALHDLAPAMAKHIRLGGGAILSGITQAQSRGVEARYRNYGFVVERRVVLDGWATLLLTRRKASAFSGLIASEL